MNVGFVGENKEIKNGYLGVAQCLSLENYKEFSKFSKNSQNMLRAGLLMEENKYKKMEFFVKKLDVFKEKKYLSPAELLNMHTRDINKKYDEIYNIQYNLVEDINLNINYNPEEIRNLSYQLAVYADYGFTDIIFWIAFAQKIKDYVLEGNDEIIKKNSEKLIKRAGVCTLANRIKLEGALEAFLEPLKKGDYECKVIDFSFVDVIAEHYHLTETDINRAKDIVAEEEKQMILEPENTIILTNQINNIFKNSRSRSKRFIFAIKNEQHIN